MIVDPPRSAWYRADEQPPAGEALAAGLHVRDAATARALRAYLASTPRTQTRRTVDTTL